MGENNTPITQISGAGQINISVSHKKGSSLQLVFSPNNNLRSTPSSHFPTCIFSFFFPETGVPVLQKKEGDGPACSFNPQGNVLTVNIPDPKTMYAPCATPANWQQNAQQITVPYVQHRSTDGGDRFKIRIDMGMELSFRNVFVYTCTPYPKFQISCSFIRPESFLPPNTPIHFDYIHGGVTPFVNPSATLRASARCSGNFFIQSGVTNLKYKPEWGFTAPFTGGNCAQCYGIYPAQHY